MIFPNVTVVTADHDLLPLYKTRKGGYVVSARDLFKALRQPGPFADWFDEQCLRYQWECNQDYALQVNPAGPNSTRREYALKLPHAVQIAAAEATPLGGIVHDWFIGLQRRLLAQSQGANTVLPALLEHTQETTQMALARLANEVAYERRGTYGVIDYNRLMCQLHTGSRPSDIVAGGKQLGLPTHWCTSAKTVLRRTQPAIACSMSLTDQLVTLGLPLSEAYEIAKLSQPVFEALVGNGMLVAEIK